MYIQGWNKHLYCQMYISTHVCTCLPVPAYVYIYVHTYRGRERELWRERERESHIYTTHVCVQRECVTGIPFFMFVFVCLSCLFTRVVERDPYMFRTERTTMDCGRSSEILPPVPHRIAASAAEWFVLWKHGPLWSLSNMLHSPIVTILISKNLNLPHMMTVR